MMVSSDPQTLRLRDWSGLACWPVYIYDRAYAVGDKSWTGKGALHNAAWLVRAGTVTVSNGRNPATARAGEWMFPPRGKHHSAFSAEAAILSVRFHALWPDGRALLDPPRAVVLPRQDSRVLTQLAKRLERFAARNFVQADTGLEWKLASAAQYLALNRHFFAWLEECVIRFEAAGFPPATPARADERALRAAHLLNTARWQDPFDLASLARHVGLSPAHLNRIFAAAFNVTPKAYHLERRKRAAARLLQEEQRPIKEAAAVLGFSSLCYFTAWFRKTFGLPPGQWRENQAAPRPRA